MNHPKTNDPHSAHERQSLQRHDPRRLQASELDSAFARGSAADAMVTPTSHPPTLAELRGRVTRRRRFRRTISLGGLTTAAGIALLVWGFGSPPPDSTSETRPVRIADRRVPASPAEPQATATEPPVTVAQAAAETSHGVSLIAEISSPAPVFELDQTTNELTHLGWVLTRERVPVDVDGFAPDQQQAISNVLYQPDAAIELYPSL